MAKKKKKKDAPYFPLTERQFLILTILKLKKEMDGLKLMEELNARGEGSSFPAFYMQLGRLEAKGYVTRRPEKKSVGPHKQTVTFNFYSITKDGNGVWTDHKSAYDRLIESVEAVSDAVLGDKGGLPAAES